jgi:serine/threonine-protein kinase
MSLDLDTTSTLADEVLPAHAPTGAPSVLDVQGSSLELAERGPRQESLWQEDKPRGRPWLKVVVAIGVVAALSAGVVVMLPHIQGRLQGLARTAAARGASGRMLTIHSTPEGATVTIDGAELGTTPLVMDNIYPPQQSIPVKLTLPGHKPWKGSFTGGQAMTLDARLEKR